MVPNQEDERRISTEEFARRNQVSAQTVIKRRSLHGSYFGALARELLNGRLDWPDITVVGRAKRKRRKPLSDTSDRLPMRDGGKA